MRWVESITKEEWEKIDQVIAKYRGRHGALIPVLKETQEICGYLPKNVQHRIAEGLQLPSSQIYGVVSFYAFFTTIPRGKHIIRVCLGTACYVKDSRQILENIEQELGLKVGGITRDSDYARMAQEGKGRETLLREWIQGLEKGDVPHLRGMRIEPPARCVSTPAAGGYRF